MAKSDMFTHYYLMSFCRVVFCPCGVFFFRLEIPLRLTDGVCCPLLLSSYYINLCWAVHGGLTDCPDSATVCRRTAARVTQALGRVYTQKMTFAGEHLSK